MVGEVDKSVEAFHVEKQSGCDLGTPTACGKSLLLFQCRYFDFDFYIEMNGPRGHEGREGPKRCRIFALTCPTE